MKRFFGWGLVLAGGAVGGWGIISVLRGSSAARLDVTSELSVSALTAGLAGVAVLTIGLIWARD